MSNILMNLFKHNSTNLMAVFLPSIRIQPTKSLYWCAGAI